MRLSLGSIVAALCIGAAPVAAQPKPAEAKIGRVAPGIATSPCIGSITSPVCMTETLLACFARVDAALCAKVGADPKAITHEPGPIEYVIDRVNVIRAEDITEDLREVDWFKAGYTLVELRRRNCPASGSCNSETWDDLQVYLRPRENVWEIVTWRGESESEGAPELPDAYRPQPRPQ